MRLSLHGKKYLPLVMGALLIAGLGAAIAVRSGGPSLIERIVERGRIRGQGTKAGDRGEGSGVSSGSSLTPDPSPLTPGAERPADAAESDRGAPGVIRFEGEGLRLAHLRIARAGYRAVRSRLAVTGTVEPNLAGVVKVTPRVAGKITAVPVDVGDAVRAGQPLAMMTSAELAQAQAAYRQAAARVAVARDNLQRQKQLASLGSFARPSLEAARGEAATAQADLGTAETGVATAQAGVDESESELQVLGTALEQAQSQALVARSRFHRADLLLKAGIFSQQSWEQARADDQKAQADVAAARARLAQGQVGIDAAKAGFTAARAKQAAARQRARIAAEALAREQAVYRGGYATSKEIVAAEAALQQAQLDRRAAADSARLLGGTPGGGDALIVAAPLSGDVTDRRVTLGQSVTPSDTLFTIMNLRTVWVQLNAYPDDVPEIRAGQRVTVTSDTAPGRTFDGVVSFISDLVDPTTHTVKVRCVIRNPGDLLKPGTFVRGAIVTEGHSRALVVPAGAVQPLNGQSVVFVPSDRAGEFFPRAVQVGTKFGPWVEIRAGLQAGDRVVTRNAFLVKSQAMKGQFGDEDADQGDKG